MSGGRHNAVRAADIALSRAAEVQSVAASLGELRAAIYQGPGLSSGAAQAAASRALSLSIAPQPLRIAIVHTYTSSLLEPWLKLAAALDGFAAEIHHAPYGLALDEAREGSALRAFAPDLTLILLRPDDLDPALSHPLAQLSADDRATLADRATQALEQIVLTFRGAIGGRLVTTVMPALYPPDLGLLDPATAGSERGWWQGVKARFAEAASARIAGVSFLDLDELVADIGRRAAFDYRTWYSAAYPWSARGSVELARRVAAIATVEKRPRVKVIAVDADNTLWGGVVGEDGINGVALGPDYPGRCYMDFQRRLLGYQQRGFLLALVSKNNAEDVAQMFADHPHMLLKERHFAASRVNWVSKPENLASIAEELSLGLDSFVFVDDSDYECAAVRSAFPEVEVVRVPSRPVELPGCLDLVSRLEITSLTAEDRAKTQLYAAERERRDHQRALQAAGLDFDDYLASLEMRMEVRFDDGAQLRRLAQLTQKTNQFNLTTRRYSEEQIADLLAAPDATVAHFSLADRFGHHGVVGLAIARYTTEQEATIDSFLMSCRVIGRRAEEAFLETLLRHLRDNGVKTVTGKYQPTAKNGLARGFLGCAGFVEQGNGLWRRDLATNPPSEIGGFAIEVSDAVVS